MFKASAHLGLLPAIRSMSKWIELWNSIHPLPVRPPLSDPSSKPATDPQKPEREPAPLLYFSKFTLIMPASGRRPSVGYAVAITSVLQDRAATRVNVLKTGPGKDCGIIDVPTSPIALAVIPRTDGTIVFDIAEVDCANHD
jgi:hypothetical protein